MCWRARYSRLTDSDVRGSRRVHSPVDASPATDTRQMYDAQPRNKYSTALCSFKLFKMLAIQKGHKHQGKCVPNVLPCRVNHDGQADVSKRYWAPNKSEGEDLRMAALSWKMLISFTDGKTVSYFRGRQLLGRPVDIPDGYKGLVLSSTDTPKANEVQPERRTYTNGDPDEEATAEGILEEMAHFDEFMVWDHEAQPDETTDPYIRGIEEWIAFAEVVCRPALRYSLC